MYEGPQQNTDGVTLSQQLDQPGCTEKLQETHVDGVHGLGQQKKEGGRVRMADRRERQDVKHRWRKSSQHGLSCVWRQGRLHRRKLGKTNVAFEAGRLRVFF